jgi:all-trans-retinol dehydrogenase (NAD+)
MSFARSKPSVVSAITAPIRLALTDPRVTGPLLIALTYFPEKLKRRLPAALHAFLTSSRFVQTLKVALSIGLLKTLNNAYSQYTVDNWKGNARFVKSQELVLITGGCSGIGELMAKQFAEKGVKVVVLDINAPKTPLRKVILLSNACSQTSDKTQNDARIKLIFKLSPQLPTYFSTKPT